MKRPLSVLAIAVLGAGLAVAGVAAPASATPTATPSIIANCVSLDVDLSGYATDPGAPAVTEERIVTPAIEEVSHTDYEYKTTRMRLDGWKPVFYDVYRWAHKDGGHHQIYDWETWWSTGNTQKHIDVAAQDAVTETVEITPAVPANPTPNTVTVEIDGETVVDGAAFGETFTQGFSLDKYTEQSYTVTVESFDGAGEGVFTGTSPACALGAANPAAVIETSCGVADVDIANAALAADAINATVSVVVYVDGKAVDFFAPAENATPSKQYTFAEDSGDHTIVVRTGPAHGDLVLDSATVSTDCIENPVGPADGTLAITGDFVAGGDITVTGDGFAPNTEYDVELHSDPQSLGTVTTDAEGDFRLDATIAPSTPAGEHDVVLLEDGEEVASTGITIAAASGETPGAETPATATPTPSAAPAGAASKSTGLAATGVDANGALLAAFALLAFGAVAYGATRRAARSRG
ncbi:hypothetical protein ACFVTX_05870 [Agromyces sp. NPDC058136]|uniref:hypothetical protein n=1 Tax=Agromyces sp. NPDC058136 TaxID=3346354 RepID=UPI0036DB1A48